MNHENPARAQPGPASPPAVWGPLPALPATLRPHRNFLTYSALESLLLGPAFWVKLLYSYFRYRTLVYEVDEEGITMRWGIFFRREVSLTYARIQDIHLTSNVVERWLGLARIQVQTASGSAKAEMIIEGLQFFEPLRDFLYDRMRGSRPRLGTAPPHELSRGASPEAATLEELTATLREVASEVRALREALRPSSGGSRAD
ncbi:putative membrane protein [Archangium gephyra]|uniref:Glutamate synthase [NADPH] large chain n=1 Tax=Archangium gephyra TaxID=48 RepID=A0AAC8TCJ4_9BACT|nr:PH domain-containing protein [Archangium gephyra]AKJ00807.1 Glutamate synthase [NADPH] large chain [Archangium gephyra]REG25975.1 putative membrane protein [Archangium gephyra]